MIRCASARSRSPIGISAAFAVSAPSRPRSVSRSAQISTAARDVFLPAYAAQARSSSCSSAGWLLTRVTAGTVSSTIVARSQGISARSSRAASSAKVMTPTPATPSDGSSWPMYAASAAPPVTTASFRGGNLSGKENAR